MKNIQQKTFEKFLDEYQQIYSPNLNLIKKPISRIKRGRLEIIIPIKKSLREIEGLDFPNKYEGISILYQPIPKNGKLVSFQNYWKDKEINELSNF